MSSTSRNRYITISSAGNPSLVRKNTASNFTIQLPQTVTLPPTSTHYEVAITNLILPGRFFNITSDSNTILIKKSKMGKKEKIRKSFILRRVYNIAK